MIASARSIYLHHREEQSNQLHETNCSQLDGDVNAAGNFGISISHETVLKMGWAYGVLNDKREVGYSVSGLCEEANCEAEINRGLSYLCGSMHGQDDGEGCGHYFCDAHLLIGGPNQMCEQCFSNWEGNEP